jgi:ABC-type multidrug transport system ATPase subunit
LQTTIINLVTGKAKKTEGTIRVNGEVVDDLSKWKKLVGFVPQEDVMIRNLTVRDNIGFSANYRLPASMSYDEAQGVVNDTLLSLGIDHVQHSIIGDERERGVSGGQRKRVNIGIELAALPRVLFLDEPTSGLDSTSSTTLTKQLKSIAVEQKVTIAAVIHQPSMATFHEFDDLLLLGRGGMVVYQGPVCDAVAYFSSIGFNMKTPMNPADFFLDITNGAIERDNDPSFETPDLFRFWNNKLNGRPLDYNPDDDHASPIHGGTGDAGGLVRTATLVGSTQHEQDIDATLNPLTSSKNFCHFVRKFFEFIWHAIVDTCVGIQEVIILAFSNCGRKEEVRVTPGATWQLLLCMKRAFKQKYRNYGALATQMLIHMGVALVVGSVSTDLQYVGPLPDVICSTVTRDLFTPCTDPLVDSYASTANFLSLGTIFAAISVSTITFGGEQVNYWRESAAGLRTTPYFIAKWLIEFPNIVLASCFFWLAFQIRFPNTNSSGALFLFFFSVYWWAWSLGFLLSALVAPDKVFLLGVLAAILLAVGFSGTNPTIDEVNDMSPAISWLWSCSGTRWLLEAFYVSQVDYYETVPSGPLEGEPYMNVQAGLDKYGYNIDNFGRSIRGLWWCGLGYGLLALVIMMNSNRDKKK